MEDLESSRLPLRTKVTWTFRYLSGKQPDWGSTFFQHFGMLINLRNAVVHLKDEEESLYYDDGSMDTKGTPKVVLEMAAHGLIRSPYRPTWLAAVTNLKVAEWSCVTAAEMARTIIDALPASDFKEFVARFHVVPFDLLLQDAGLVPKK